MRKSKKTYILLICIFLAGLGIFLYPEVSSYWNSLHQTRSVAEYSEIMESMDDSTNAVILEAAYNYNQEVSRNLNTDYVLNEERRRDYMAQLDIGINGAMGYIEIPDINVILPIYHTTEPEILQIGVGHLEWSSLPVGGYGTHCVLSSHRGLPSSRLFTDLDKLETEDLFMIRVLNEILTYEVDQILIVEPDDVSSLKIADGKDYCTLVTCTPYGINTHRLLVRGHRIANQSASDGLRIVSDAAQIEPVMVAPVMSVPLIILLLAGLIYNDRMRRKKAVSADLEQVREAVLNMYKQK